MRLFISLLLSLLFVLPAGACEKVFGVVILSKSRLKPIPRVSIDRVYRTRRQAKRRVRRLGENKVPDVTVKVLSIEKKCLR